MPCGGVFEVSLGSWELTWFNKQIPVDVYTYGGRRRSNVSAVHGLRPMRSGVANPEQLNSKEFVG